ncbi:MKI67 FHA domain-interacting nucleolar phosphoprotein-like isoform X1 [Ostrinia nubilalis]|uniref:MKI67 FHA domain-interacting nucleolar phosphoprotein-like isoform X1 n=1 Tax=Ostrinia nubilalis TaxID=29057 RepID=UPI003082371B
MEEIVALDSSKQKQFVKSIKGIKNLIKKNDEKEVVKPQDGKAKKKKKGPQRGLVYLGHIPHGFYENEMTQYFKQFGVVTNVRVIRSKRTGHSKGFAFVEFKDTAVAEIVAETMNNYLMGKRLIKAAYIPPEKQRIHARRKFWSSTFNPGSEARLKQKKIHNANKDEQGELKKAKKLLSTLTKQKNKLKALGIEYKFEPVDVPESLLQLLSSPVVKQEDKAVKRKLDNEKKEVKPKDTNKQTADVKKDKKKLVNQNKSDKSNVKPEITAKVEEKPKKSKKPKPEVKVDIKQQNQKEKKLKESGVKPVENFIKIQEESGEDSDSSYAFDSDEFEKMLGDVSGDDSDGSDDSDEADDLEESDSEEEPPKKIKHIPTKGPVAKAAKQIKNEDKKKMPQRRPSINMPVPPKKSKFENRNTQKLAKKQFKKKK